MTLDALYRLGVRENIPLAPLTTWRVGGSARFFCEPTIEECPEILFRAHELGIPAYFLGRGSNVLIDDEGIDGLVICTRRSLQNLRKRKDFIEAEAGVPLPRLSRFAANLGLGGYEFLIGIPGTVGGGAVINAGLSNQCTKDMSDILLEVDVLTCDRSLTLARDQLSLSYRSSALLNQDLLLIRARFRVDMPRSSELVRRDMARHLAERRRKQPLSKRTAGSTFKRPSGGRAAAWYIERAGLKGFRIGGATVSQKHANWIENDGTATARDIKNLIQHIQERVFEQFGVSLEREVLFLPADQHYKYGSRLAPVSS